MLSLKCGRRMFVTPMRCISSNGKKTPYEGDRVLVPDEPKSSTVETTIPVPEFDSKLITHLERLSLVRFSDEEAVASLRAAVKRANRLLEIDTTNVEPMFTVWEDQDCPLHDDIPEESMPLEKVLGNAAKVYEDYFVTPPGNIPLEESNKPLNLELINEWDRLGVPSVAKPKDVRMKAKESEKI